MNEKTHIKGRGAQTNPHNRFKAAQYDQYHAEGIDEWEEETKKLHLFLWKPKHW